MDYKESLLFRLFFIKDKITQDEYKCDQRRTMAAQS